MKKERFQKSSSDQICNICLQSFPLSDDHVPPKSITSKRDALVTSWLEKQLLTNNSLSSKPFISQSGVKFKTICRDCNSRMSEGDTQLRDLASNVHRMIESPLSIPRPVTFRTCPNLIIRSVLGHLLASKSKTDKVTFDEQVRPCLQNFSLPIPSNVHIFPWIYPFKKSFIIRDLIMYKLGTPRDSFSISHVLKFYPLAFLISDNPEFEGLKNMDEFHSIPFNQPMELSLDLGKVNEEDWPHSIKYQDLIGFGTTGGEAVIAEQRGL